MTWAARLPGALDAELTGLVTDVEEVVDALVNAEQSGRGTDAEEIVDAVAMAFEFFTRRAGGIPIPENIPTWDNLQFASAVTRLDRVCVASGIGKGKQGGRAGAVCESTTKRLRTRDVLPSSWRRGLYCEG